MPELLRSDVELSKRMFLDRLTTDAQPLLQPNIDAGPGDEYEYAGVGDAMNFGVSFDCSGIAGVMLAVAIFGGSYFSGGFKRLFSTESFPGPLPGFRQTSRDDCIRGAYPLKVFIMHGGGGPNSHMACQIDGWWMESNGEHGICTEPGQINGADSDIWNDWWVFDGPITEDTTWRQPMSYPKGFDYAGGRPRAADIAAAGGSFVCRYLTDGGPGLPGKQLLPAEFADLVNGGVQVVFNWETTSDFMLGGHDAGRADAQNALNYIHTLPGVPASWAPVVYFSCDFDEAPNQDVPVEAYCDGATEILGTEPGGRRRVGMYGPYWILSRALNAGKVGYAWQTEAWSGGNIDARIDLMQRNGLGFVSVGGVQCDINEAHSVAFGQYPGAGAQPVPPPPPGPPPPTGDPSVDFLTWLSSASDHDINKYIAAQLGPGDPSWVNKGMTVRDKLWSLVAPRAANPKVQAGGGGVIPDKHISPSKPKKG